LIYSEKEKKKKEIFSMQESKGPNIPRIRGFRVKAWLGLNEEHRRFGLRYQPSLSREPSPATLSTHNFASFPNQSSSSTPSPATTPFLRQTPSPVSANPCPTLLFSPTKKIQMIFRNKRRRELYSVFKNVSLVNE